MECPRRPSLVLKSSLSPDDSFGQSVYDNSVPNPSHPDPKRAVARGDPTFEEMMTGDIDYVDDASVAIHSRMGFECYGAQM
jgi:hypothetical protein